MFLFPAGKLASNSYEISNSLMLDSSLGQYLSRVMPPTVQDTSLYKKTINFKIKRCKLSAQQALISNIYDGNNYWTVVFDASDHLVIYGSYSATNVFYKVTTAVFRDVSAHYHIQIIVDTTSATAEDRIQLLVNGSRITTFSTNTLPAQNLGFYFAPSGGTWYLSIGQALSGNYLDAYLSDLYAVDGQALDSSYFGRTDTTTGQWVPKAYSGTYGNNGFHLEFKNSGALGTDTSGNGLTFTLNGGISNTNQTTDTPTNNYAVLNRLDTASTLSLSKGSLKATWGGLGRAKSSFQFPSSGKWQCELVLGTASNSNTGYGIGICHASVSNTAAYNAANAYSFYASASGCLVSNGTNMTSSLAALTAGDTIQMCVDIDSGYVWIGKNNVWYNSTGATTGNPASGLNPTFTVNATGMHVFVHLDATSAANAIFNAGQTAPTYAFQSGFKSLCTRNLPEPSIKLPSIHMTVRTDTGANIKGICESAFTYFLEWIKDRANANNHQLIDTVRGTSVVLQSNTTVAETTYSAPSGSSVGWVFNAGGAAVTNTAGSVTSQVSANVAAGFSTVTWASNGVAGATVGHGLGVAPKFIIHKQRNGGNDWWCYHKSLSSNAYALRLNGTDAQNNTVNFWNNTDPSSNTFTMGFWTGNINATPGINVSYCFAEVAGFSKFGSYTGNGLADGPFVYCGFRPRFILLKETSGANAATSGWIIHDTQCSPYNASQDSLWPNSSAAALSGSSYAIDILSNGFKLRSTVQHWNESAGSYIFAAFAESPFKYSNAR